MFGILSPSSSVTYNCNTWDVPLAWFVFKLEVEIPDTSGAKFSVTFTPIAVLPLLPYWSFQVIVVAIKEPSVLPLPLISLPTDNLPLEATDIRLLEEAKFVAVWLP